MKKIILSFIIILFSLSVFTQNEQKLLGVSERYFEDDTLRSFHIALENKDKCIEHFIKLWGEPNKNTTGYYIWNEMSIEGIEQKVEIVISDGVFEFKKKSARYTPFKDAQTKTKALEKLGENAHRETRIDFNGPDGKNLINSQELEVLITEMLKKELSKLK